MLKIKKKLNIIYLWEIFQDKKNTKNDNFLKSISLKPKIFVPDKSNIVRFFHMKTNQFNFRTIRMTKNRSGYLI